MELLVTEIYFKGAKGGKIFWVESKENSGFLRAYDVQSIVVSFTRL